jgi:2-dehydropantoate 2-reductase
MTGDNVLKIAVLGAGSLGCAIGGTLARAGSQVTLINRRAEQADAINRNGLVMEEGGQSTTVRLQAANRCADVGPVDLVIVLVKSFDTRSAMEGAAPLLGPGTTVLSLQNGLGHEDVLASMVGRERLLAGKTYVGGVLTRPGVGAIAVSAGTRGKHTYIGELDGAVSPRVRRVAGVFNAAGLATTVCEDIMGTIWEKLLVNVATGALSGITRLPYGELYRVPEVEACAVAAVAEAMAVARASGIKLSTREPRDAWVKAAEGLPCGFKASMLQSLEKGAVTEIDFINGAVVEQGAKLGVPTPVNSALVACIKGAERAMLLAAGATVFQKAASA